LRWVGLMYKVVDGRYLWRIRLIVRFFSLITEIIDIKRVAFSLVTIFGIPVVIIIGIFVFCIFLKR